jgi:EpsI family protein
MLKRLKGSAYLPVLLLALAAAVLYSSRPERLTGVDFGRIPESFPGWRGRDIAVDPVSVEILQPDAILMRRYEDAEGRPSWLCIVYHQNNKYGAHDVPVCYTSQGYAKKSLDREQIAAGPGGLTVNRLVAGKTHDTRVVYYWFVTGGEYFADAGEFRRAQMISGLIHNRSHGALVRLETQIQDADVAGAEARLRDLTARVVENLPRAFSAGR